MLTKIVANDPHFNYAHRPLEPFKASQTEMSAEQCDYAQPSSEVTVVYFHGGAHLLGSPPGHRKLVAQVCESLQCHVVSVAYRLCPEHPHPAALFDGVSAYLHAC